MTEIEKTVILAFAENDMNLSKTAIATHYDRNTIYYRLCCIRKKYGLNPKKFYDLIELVKMAKGSEKE